MFLKYLLKNLQYEWYQYPSLKDVRQKKCSFVRKTYAYVKEVWDFFPILETESCSLREGGRSSTVIKTELFRIYFNPLKHTHKRNKTIAQ